MGGGSTCVLQGVLKSEIIIPCTWDVSPNNEKAPEQPRVSWCRGRLLCTTIRPSRQAPARYENKSSDDHGHDSKGRKDKSQFGLKVGYLYPYDSGGGATIAVMPNSYIANLLWNWAAHTGLPLALVVVAAFLVPRVGRFIIRIVDHSIASRDDHDEGKTRRAFAGVAVYLGQLLAYFLLLVALLKILGFSLVGAAIPATVASAAIGLGAQSIIADFLAGFFILTEKQFGVGDWVRFEGNGIQVEGTVIQITMRATRIRTLAEETVIIPNSTARVCINSSNYWSCAVVVIPVPLLGSDSPQEAIERSRRAAQGALERSDIQPMIRGDLEVQPAVSITPPTTVGMPWMMDMRLLVQVNAGSQWAVERAIRTAIVSEFWDEYGSATTMTGHVQRDLKAHIPGMDVPEPAPGEHYHSPRAGAAEVHEIQDPASTDNLNGPQPKLSRMARTEEEVDEAAGVSGLFRTEHYKGATRQIFSLGGKIRPSTGFLLFLLGLLIVLRGMTLQTGENWDGPDGWLAPPRPSTSSTSTPAPSSPAAPVSPSVSSPVPTTGTQQPQENPRDGVQETPHEGAGTGAGQGARPNPGETPRDTATSTPGNAPDERGSESSTARVSPTERSSEVSTTTPVR